MARIDIKTLVLAFEKRIEALEKNPPDKVPTAVIINLLENAVDDIIKEHFIHLAKKEINVLVEDEFKERKDHFVREVLESILTDKELKEKIKYEIKSCMLINLNKVTNKI